MIFTTPEFVLFFVLFFGVYAAFPGRWRKGFLLAASYLFYGSWNAKFLLLIVGSTLLDFYVGSALRTATESVRRKRLVTLSVCGNLGVLGIFKYFDFFVGSAAALMQAVGLRVDLPVLQVILPVGISFYTFQTMSYTLDIYRGKLEPTESLLDFALFVAFFPQLVAGPIERAAHLLPQIVGLSGRRSDLSGWGFLAIGAFKKVVIADQMAKLVEVTYASPGDVYGPALWIGTYAFAIQIYCDFSGYSDIAVGLGRLLGLDIVQNFKAPYGADGPRDFWRRWHISLSSWLRDYLYIPLGGNRGGWLRVRWNLMATMLLGGLWHGAAWNFVLWGGFHGLLLTVFRPAWLGRIAERLSRPLIGRVMVTLVRRVLFFHLVCISWALFRAQSLTDSLTVVRKLVDVRQWRWDHWLGEVHASGEGRYLLFMGGVAVLIVVAQNVVRVGSDSLVARLWRLPLPLRFVLIVALFYACVLLSPERPPPFIYFQF